MAAESCHDCAYAFWDMGQVMEGFLSGFGSRPVCANHPESPGRMRRATPRGVCVNYRPRPATPKGDVRQIPLGGGFYVYVDAADYEWLNQWTWYLGNGYAYRLEKGKLILMHRQIMQPPKGKVVHHKNHNKLDNTRENMGNVTPAENARERAKKRKASSRFWGVSYTTSRDKYQVSVHHEGKLFACGWFTDEIEAARAHDYRAVALKGEAARLNFPEEWPPERRAQVHAQWDAARKGHRKAVKKNGAKVRRGRAKRGRQPRARVKRRQPGIPPRKSRTRSP